MKKEYFSFYHGEKCLCMISVEGCFYGEIKATAELLAYENNIKVDDIKLKIEYK